MTVPPKIGVRELRHYLSRPVWTRDALMRRDFQLANIAHRAELGGSGTFTLIDFLNQQFDRGVTWEDAAWLRGVWDGPLVIKGVLTADDAQRAADIGATAIMVSNHGGRQLDAAAAPISCIAEIRNRVGSSVELIVDGGVRRGTHVLKALALGADACSIGRPYLYGLAAGGQAGVERALGLLKEEMLRGAALLGCRSISEITIDKVRAVRPCH
jgi:L-lactate dehydrogenase (cytochrome)